MRIVGLLATTALGLLSIGCGSPEPVYEKDYKVNDSGKAPRAPGGPLSGTGGGSAAGGAGAGRSSEPDGAR